MKKIITLLSSIIAAAALQAAPVILVVDTAQVYSNYYKAKEADAQIQSSIAQTQQELQKMEEKHKELEKQLAAVQEKMNNPALTEDARRKIAQEEGSPKYNEMMGIEANIKNVSAQARQRIEQNVQSIRAIHLQEIKEAVAKIAEAKKADFIVEKGVLLYSKPEAEITQEVIAAINAGAPAPVPAAAAKK